MSMSFLSPSRLLVGLAGLALLAGAAVAQANGAKAPAPTSADVVLRGTKDLANALLLAAGGVPRPGAEKPPTVLYLLEPYSNVLENEAKIAAAFRALDRRYPLGSARFRLGVLGRTPGEAVESPGLLAPRLAKALRDPGTSPADEGLFAAVRRAAAACVGPGRIVLVVDELFEEDEDLEACLTTLVSRELRLSVLAPEAGFGRAWQEPYLRRLASQRGLIRTVTLSPFENAETKLARWRSGDVAWPHQPGTWRILNHLDWPWNDEFELRPAKSQVSYGRAALPSSFGAWGLSRAAAVTGGRYVLWSWKSSPAAGPTYDDVRCDRYAPDLRSRAEIFADADRRPLARVLLEAWNALSGDDASLLSVKPPVQRGRATAMTPAPYDGAVLAACFQERSDRDRFVGRVAKTAKVLEQLEKKLAAALAASPADRDAIDRRYAADVDLLRHLCLHQRFALGEAARTAAEDIPNDAWDGREYPGLVPSLLVPASDLGHRLVTSLPGMLRDAALFEHLKADRAAFLERYRGTPFAEIVARHYIATAATAICGTGRPYRPPPGARSGSNSGAGKTQGGGGAPPRPAAPGSSGGGGGTTGGSGGGGSGGGGG
jgi:hypothetical protein